MTIQNKNLLATLKKAYSIQGVKIVTKADISNSLRNASTLPRSREPIIIHESFEEVPQRFINCFASPSYVRPHMHVVPNQWELMTWISGEIVALLFDDDGKVSNKIIMNENDARVIEIPPFRYHTFFVRNEGAYLETRNCKYQPLVDRVYSGWAPPENSPAAAAYYQRLLTAEIGSILTL